MFPTSSSAGKANEKVFTTCPIAWMESREYGKYTEGTAKKHRSFGRCQALDKNDTIKMRNSGFHKGNCKIYSTICKKITML
jgi:hypothetical protein